MNWVKRLPYESILLILTAFVIGYVVGGQAATFFTLGAVAGMLTIIFRAQRDRNFWRGMH